MRSMRIRLKADELYSAWRRGVDSLKKLRYQRPEIGKPVCLSLKDNDGNREQSQILLKGQVLIDRYQHVEMLTHKGQQFSILECRPPHLASRLELMPQ